MRGLTRYAAIVFGALLAFAAACGEPPARTPFRLGHFATVTHTHALVARGTTERGDGIFEKHLGADVTMEWLLFASGGSALAALRDGRVDAIYVGPSPVLEAVSRSQTDDLRVLAGATVGGAALVVRKDAGITGPKDFRGRRIATPQRGNTQDVQCRAWLAANGYTITGPQTDVTVVSLPQSEQFEQWKRGDLDAVWTVEPWVSRLEREGNGTVLVRDDAMTTLLVTSTRFLREHPDRVQRLLAAHRELTSWLGTHAEEARALVSSQLDRVTGTTIDATLVDHCWPRLQFTDAVQKKDLELFVENARRAAFDIGAPDLDRLLGTR